MLYRETLGFRGEPVTLDQGHVGMQLEKPWASRESQLFWTWSCMDLTVKLWTKGRVDYSSGSESHRDASVIRQYELTFIDGMGILSC